MASNHELWNRILDHIDDRVSTSDIEAWLSHAELVRVEPHPDASTPRATLTVQVANHLYVNWITDNLLPAVVDAASRELRAEVELKLVTQGGGHAERDARRGEESGHDAESDEGSPGTRRSSRGPSDERALDIAASLAALLVLLPVLGSVQVSVAIA